MSRGESRVSSTTAKDSVPTSSQQAHTPPYTQTPNHTQTHTHTPTHHTHTHAHSRIHTHTHTHTPTRTHTYAHTGPMTRAGLAALIQKAFVRTDDVPEDAATGAPAKNVATPAPHLDTGDEMGGNRNGERPAPVGVFMMDVDQGPCIAIGNV